MVRAEVGLGLRFAGLGLEGDRSRIHEVRRSDLKDSERHPHGEATAALVPDVLGERSEPNAGYMNRLFEKRQALVVIGAACLAHAMAVGKEAPSNNVIFSREPSHKDGPVAGPRNDQVTLRRLLTSYGNF
jgi:hypothetical protein